VDDVISALHKVLTHYAVRGAPASAVASKRQE